MTLTCSVRYWAHWRATGKLPPRTWDKGGCPLEVVLWKQRIRFRKETFKAVTGTGDRGGNRTSEPRWAGFGTLTGWGGGWGAGSSESRKASEAVTHHSPAWSQSSSEVSSWLKHPSRCGWSCLISPRRCFFVWSKRLEFGRRYDSLGLLRVVFKNI